MSTGRKPSGPMRATGDLDEHGHARPMSVDELERRRVAIVEALASLDTIGSADEQRHSLEALAKAVDDDRGRGRKVFGSKWRD